MSIDAVWSMEDIRSEPGVNLWVFNRTASLKNSVHRDSIVHLIVPVGSEKVTVKIPSTWIPVNIGLQAPKKAILEAADFLRGVNMDFLQPITNKKAKEFFEGNADAGAEYDSVISKMRKRSSKDMTINNQNNQNVNVPNTNIPAPLETGNVEDIEASPRIIQAVFKYTENDINETEFVGVLRKEMPLEDKDVAYVMKNVNSKKIHNILVNNSNK